MFDDKCEDIASDEKSKCFINIYYSTKTLFTHNDAQCYMAVYWTGV